MGTIKEEFIDGVRTVAEKTLSVMNDGSDYRIAVADEILDYAKRFKEIKDALCITIQEIEDFKRLVGQCDVYKGEAQNDMFTYYERLSEIIYKCCEYYDMGGSLARYMYVQFMDLDAAIARLYTLAKKD